MSVSDFLTALEHYNLIFGIFLLLLPAVAWVLLRFFNPYLNKSPIHYALSVIIYLAAIPGMFASVLVFYALFFIRLNLLEVNVVLFFLPIITMGAVFFIIGRKAKFDDLPGFDRLSGLMLLLALVAGIVLALYKLHFIVGFFASIEGLLIAGLGVFALLKLSLAKLSGKRSDS